MCMMRVMVEVNVRQACLHFFSFCTNREELQANLLDYDIRRLTRQPSVNIRHSLRQTKYIVDYRIAHVTIKLF